MAWDDLDRGYALAWQQEQAARHTCGQPFAESSAVANQVAYRAEVIRCHACAAQQRVYDAFMKQENANGAGLLVRLTHGPHGLI